MPASLAENRLQRQGRLAASLWIVCRPDHGVIGRLAAIEEKIDRLASAPRAP